MIARQFLSFSAIGTLAFVIDTAVLYFALAYLSAGLYAGRVVSYVVAATFTWAMNRRYTFPRHRPSAPVKQWSGFLLVNLCGGFINFGIYALLVSYHDFVAAHPVVGVAAGSLGGLTVNFVLSRSVIFRSASPTA
jgi:putative flippase GtrA